MFTEPLLTSPSPCRGFLSRGVTLGSVVVTFSSLSTPHRQHPSGESILDTAWPDPTTKSSSRFFSDFAGGPRRPRVPTSSLHPVRRPNPFYSQIEICTTQPSLELRKSLSIKLYMQTPSPFDFKASVLEFPPPTSGLWPTVGTTSSPTSSVLGLLWRRRVPVYPLWKGSVERRVPPLPKESSRDASRGAGQSPESLLKNFLC